LRTDRILVYVEAEWAQGRGDVALAAAGGAQRPFRIAADRVFDQGLKRRKQALPCLDRRFASSPRTTDAAGRPPADPP
jgi:hypothetical protein